MKRIVLIGMMIAVSSFLLAQKKPKPAQTKPIVEEPAKEEVKEAPKELSPMAEHFARKYSVATRWNDFDVAKDALYDLIIEYPGNDSLIFSLAYFYYENQKYPSCVMVCSDLLSRNPKNVGALELSGISLENLNVFDKALQNFESLYLLTNNNSTLFKMASLQLELKRFEEALTNCDILMTKPEVETLKVVYNDADNKPKEYPLKAALLNLKGMIYKAQADKVNAKKFFDEALVISPDFAMAKQNLASLK